MTKIDQDRIDFAVKYLSWLETYMRHDCSGATAESLDSVMECGKDEVKQFVSTYPLGSPVGTARVV